MTDNSTVVAPATTAKDRIAVVAPLRQLRRHRIVDRIAHWALIGLAALSVLYLIAPVIVMALTSFNRSPSVSVPPREWTLSSYATISPSLYRAFFVSLELAAISTAISLIIAIPASFWIARRRGTLPSAIDVLARSPLQIPQIVIGLSLFQIFIVYEGSTGLGLRASFIGLAVGHIVLVTPYVITTCVSRIEGQGVLLEQAAASLGASNARIWLRIRLPGIKQALISAGVLGALISFDNVPISLFLASAGTSPLPVQLFSMSEVMLQPMLYAAATLTSLFSVIVALLLEKFVGLRESLGR